MVSPPLSEGAVKEMTTFVTFMLRTTFVIYPGLSDALTSIVENYVDGPKIFSASTLYL